MIYDPKMNNKNIYVRLLNKKIKEYNLARIRCHNGYSQNVKD